MRGLLLASLLALAACAAPAKAPPPAGPAPSYSIAGEYFETTSCRVGCPDMFGVGGEEESCDAVLAFRIVGGRADGVDVSGRTVAIAASSDRGGRWTGALFVDDAASAAARDALARFVAGRFGSRFASLLPPRCVPMEWRRDGSLHLLRLGMDASIGHFEIEAVPGADGNPVTIGNAPRALAPFVHLARSRANRLDDPSLGKSWRYEGRNAAYGHFEWRSP